MSETIQIQADWAQTDSTQIDFIKNKPNLYEEWWGTQAEYDAILVKDPDIIYNIIYEEPVINYFYVEDISGSDNTLSIVKNDASAPDITLYKSTDTVHWTSMGTTDTTAITATIPANGKLYLKAETTRWSGGTGGSYSGFSSTGNVRIGGYLSSLLKGNSDFENNNTAMTIKYATSSMFREWNKLIEADKLILFDNMTHGCYRWMFSKCYNLEKAPVIRGIETATDCCQSMFEYTKINSLTSYIQTITGINPIQYWLTGVSATGDFYNLGGVTFPSGASGIPTGWTEHNSL